MDTADKNVLIINGEYNDLKLSFFMHNATSNVAYDRYKTAKLS
jgi:hypothetical protein